MTSTSNELQALITTRLKAVAAVTDIVSTRILDRVPEGTDFPYVSFGPSDTIDDGDGADDCISGEIETLQIDCWSRYQGGFKELKSLTYAVRQALHLFAGEFSASALVELRVIGRRHFRDPDGLTSHGVVTVQAIMEDA